MSQEEYPVEALGREEWRLACTVMGARKGIYHMHWDLLEGTAHEDQELVRQR